MLYSTQAVVEAGVELDKIINFARYFLHKCFV